MLPRPTVSVVLPVRDAAAHLDEALESLAAQTLADFEVVAIDDGSSDGSRERLEAWSRRDSRLRVMPCPGAGLVAALNAGLAGARAPLIARMDADDRCRPRRLELQVGALAAAPEIGVVSCRVRHFADGPVGEGLRQYERWLNGLLDPQSIHRERFIESPLPHPSVVARRDLLLAAGGYRDNTFPEDYDLWLRLAEGGVRFAKVPEVLLEWRDHPERLTRTAPLYAVERFLACKAHHLARGPLRAADRVIVWGAGQTGRRLAKHLEREDVAPAAFLDIDPRKIGGSLRRRPVHPPDDLPNLLAGAAHPVVLSAVSSRGARELIRRRLDRFGLREGADYWCAA